MRFIRAEYCRGQILHPEKKETLMDHLIVPSEASHDAENMLKEES